MSYERQDWKQVPDYPDEEATVINAEMMEHIEDGIIANEAEIAKNKDSLTELYSIEHNLFTDETGSDGILYSYSNNPQPATGWRTSDFIELKDNATPLYLRTVLDGARYMFYKSDKTRLADTYVAIGATTQGVMTPTADSAYVRITYKVADDYSTQYVGYSSSYEDAISFTPNAQKAIREAVGGASLNHVTVKKDGSGDYTTIQEAVTNAQNGATIEVYSGEYEEFVIVPQNKKLNIIGVDRDSCILWNDLGDYSKAPLYMTWGSIKNMTIKSVKNPNKDYSGISNHSYCIHIDINFPWGQANKNPKMVVENCLLVSDWRYPLGCGVMNTWTLEVRNCTIISTSNSNEPQILIHNTTSDGTAYVVLDGNRLISQNTSSKSLELVKATSTAQSLIDVSAYYNYIDKLVTMADVVTLVKGFGNNATNLNI